MNDSLLHVYIQQFDGNTMSVLGKDCIRLYNRLVPFGLKRCFLPRQFSGLDVTYSESIPDRLKNNPYYKKYLFKIEKMRKEDPEKYLKLIKQLEGNNEDTQTESTPSSSVKSSASSNPTSATSSSASVFNGTDSEKKGLDSIIKLDLISELPVEDIKKIWVEYYSKKDAVCAVIPADTFTIIRTVAESYPVFLYPLPRENGYEMLMCQYFNNDFHFTSLHNYQRHKEYAPNQLTLRHFTELEKDKGIVLMSGMLTDESISVTDAQFLSYQLQHFSTQRPDLIRNFNTNPDSFKVDDIISALDNISNFAQ